MQTTRKFLVGAILASLASLANADLVQISDPVTWSPPGSSLNTTFQIDHTNQFDSAVYDYLDAATITLILTGVGQRTFAISFGEWSSSITSGAAIPVPFTIFEDSLYGGTLAFTLTMAGTGGSPKITSSNLAFSAYLLDPGTDGPGTDGPGTDGPGTDGPGTDGPGTDNPINAVPEPGTLALLGLGLLGLGAMRRRMS